MLLREDFDDSAPFPLFYKEMEKQKTPLLDGASGTPFNIYSHQTSPISS